MGRRWINSGGGVYADDAVDDSGAGAVAGDLESVRTPRDLTPIDTDETDFKNRQQQQQRQNRE